MQTAAPSVFARDHTFFGVCEALGEDLGFSPVLLRIAFGVALFFSPVGTVGVYAALGLLVAFTRFVAPVPRQAAAPDADAGGAEARETEAGPELALAA